MERVQLAEAAAVIGAVAAPVLLLARNRLVFAAGLALFVAAQLGLAFALVPDELEELAASPARLAAVSAGLVLLAAATLLLARYPLAAPALLLLAAPVRVPVSLRGEEAFLLVPFYGVLAASVLALALRLARGTELRPLPVFLAAPVSAYVALAGLSLLWSADPRAGAVNLFFFLFPGAIVVALLAQAELTRGVYRSLAVVLLASTAAVAAIGLWQQWTHTLFFADDLQASNAYTSFFRVTSIFWDSSIYGRYVALGIVVLFVLLWDERLRPAFGLPLLGLLLAGLYFSYSQSSFVALFAAVLVVLLVASDRRTRRLVAVGAAVVLLVGAGLVAVVVQDESARKATSGRWSLASRTAPVFADHPIVGVGVGAQPVASTEVEGARRRESKNVSHTTPLTVAAELGVLGLAAYTAFLLAAARSSFLALRREWAFGLALVGVLTLLLVHSLAYAGFFEDPFVWLAVGLAAACLAAPEAARRTAPARPEDAGAGPAVTSPSP
ncbi:MAG TPA: O-antigen ligase family protein [Gaiellaceae bacterium]|nr:O-antigen ligase family protein [Gaiellaceae bacterium]